LVGVALGAWLAPSDAAGIFILSFLAGFAGAPLVVWLRDLTGRDR
jgi:hypothetical protein